MTDELKIAIKDFSALISNLKSKLFTEYSNFREFDLGSYSFLRSDYDEIYIAINFVEEELDKYLDEFHERKNTIEHLHDHLYGKTVFSFESLHEEIIRENYCSEDDLNDAIDIADDIIEKKAYKHRGYFADMMMWYFQEVENLSIFLNELMTGLKTAPSTSGFPRTVIEKSFNEKGINWSCPSCKRKKQEVSFFQRNGIRNDNIVLHHDHAWEITPPKDLLHKYTEIITPLGKRTGRFQRFQPTYICGACNHICSTIKNNILNSGNQGGFYDFFSFSPAEMGQIIIESKPNTNSHELNYTIAEEILTEVFSTDPDHFE